MEKGQYDVKTGTSRNTIVHVNLHYGKNINQRPCILCHPEISLSLCIMVVEYSFSKTIKEA